MKIHSLLTLTLFLFAKVVFSQTNDDFISRGMEVQSVESVIRGTLLTPDSTL